MWTDGFLSLDHVEHQAFNESEHAVAQIEAYKKRFGAPPLYFAANEK